MIDLVQLSMKFDSLFESENAESFEKWLAEKKKIEMKNTNNVVKYLHQELSRILPQEIFQKHSEEINQLLQECDTIEMENILKAHRNGFADAYGFAEKRTAEEYYEQTYKQDS
jgi:hypothetical protein